nr:thiamine phosphate synthase [Paenibacillus shirakamiensis]
MGSQNVEGKDPCHLLSEAIYGGITLFQFREKGRGALVGEERHALAQRLRSLCFAHGVPFIVNDDIQFAHRLGADGIHLGQSDGDPVQIRRNHPHLWLGVSTHNEEEAVEAIRIGADYIGVGPMYSTRTKTDAIRPIGVQSLGRIRNHVGSFPIVAIGGIHASNVDEVIQAGADGVAVISSITGHMEPRTAAQELKDIVTKSK